MRLDRHVAGLLVLVALGLAVAGCGRRAPLDTPYQAAVEERRQALENQDDVIPPEPEPPIHDKPFFLDPLI